MSQSNHAERPELTRNQALVHEALHKAEAPMSAYALLDSLRPEGLRAPLQVYRALDKLLELGLVHRLESLNAFVACSDHLHSEDGLFAFAICESCGQVSEFSSEDLSQGFSLWAGRNGFKIKTTALEVRGLCQACQS